jgi:hypothetical protein
MTATEIEPEVVPERIWASYSQLTAHRGCPQRWQYSWLRRLQKVDPADVAVDRDFGSWWHLLRAADSIERGNRQGSIRKLPRRLQATDDSPELDPSTVTPGEVFAVAHDWWRAQSEIVQTTWVARIGQNLPDRLEALYVRWYDQWQEEIKTELPLAVEFGWGRDLPPMRGLGDPMTRLVGYVDEVYLDTRRDVVVVRDHKSHHELSTMTSVDDMMDSQLQLYAWGGDPEIKSWGLGPVRATAYDRIRNQAPRPPLMTLAGRLRQVDGKPSIGQCDLHTYVEWAKGPDGLGVAYPGARGGTPGFYQAEPEVIEKLSSPSARSVWFQRTLTPLNVNLVKGHLRAAIDSAFDIARSKARVEETGEAARNLTSNCRWCDFQRLCRDEMVGGPGSEFDLADYNLRIKP